MNSGNSALLRNFVLILCRLAHDIQKDFLCKTACGDQAIQQSLQYASRTWDDIQALSMQGFSRHSNYIMEARAWGASRGSNSGRLKATASASLNLLRCFSASSSKYEPGFSVKIGSDFCGCARKLESELESSSVGINSIIPKSHFLLPSSSLLLSFNFKPTNSSRVSRVDGIPELVMQVYSVFGP